MTVNKEGFWYLEVSGLNNELIAAVLAAEGVAMESQGIIVDNKGDQHHVWLVPYSLIRKLEANEEYLLAKQYKVFYKEGRSGIPRETKLHKLKKKSRHLKEAEEFAERMKK